MEPKIRSGQLLTDEELKKFIEVDCKLLTSKQLANVLSVSDAALRKQRSNKRSIFAYKIRNRIYYPADLIVKKLHENVIVDRSWYGRNSCCLKDHSSRC